MTKRGAQRARGRRKAEWRADREAFRKHLRTLSPLQRINAIAKRAFAGVDWMGPKLPTFLRPA